MNPTQQLYQRSSMIILIAMLALSDCNATFTNCVDDYSDGSTACEWDTSTTETVNSTTGERVKITNIHVYSYCPIGSPISSESCTCGVCVSRGDNCTNADTCNSCTVDSTSLHSYSVVANCSNIYDKYDDLHLNQPPQPQLYASPIRNLLSLPPPQSRTVLPPQPRPALAPQTQPSLAADAASHLAQEGGLTLLEKALKSKPAKAIFGAIGSFLLLFCLTCFGSCLPCGDVEEGANVDDDGKPHENKNPDEDDIEQNVTADNSGDSSNDEHDEISSR